MKFAQNTSLDMTTINDNMSATTFVKEPNVQQSTETRDIPKLMNTAPQNNIKDIQNYLKDNNNVKSIINETYTGPVDGKVNAELINVASNLESFISKIISKNVDGLILKTTASDLNNALKKVIAFNKISNQNIAKISQDQRIYELGKLKMKK